MNGNLQKSGLEMEKIHTDNKETLHNALNRIEELETRCAELFLQNNEFAEQLTKAKEIIRWFVVYEKGEGIITNYNIFLEQAEQFLNGDGCPDALCEDCTKEDCTVKKLGLVSTKEIKEND